MEDKMRGWDARSKILHRSIPVPEAGCWLWLAGTNASGYGIINHGSKSVLAHRLSWTAFVGQIPEGMHVLHRCDTRPCVNPAHLFIGTNFDNVQDKVRKHRAIGQPGEQNRNAKLSRDDVLLIRSDTRGCYRIARDFGVSPQTIWRVKTNNNWKSL